MKRICLPSCPVLFLNLRSSVLSRCCSAGRGGACSSFNLSRHWKLHTKSSGMNRILDPLLHIYIMMTSNYVLLNPEEKTDKTIVQQKCRCCC
uniref:Secreted protein n=1 Tax=Oryza nivara TaxID=4536 RepID=A0A0E0H2A2_ORYNI